MEKWLTIDEYMDTFLAMIDTIGSIGALFFVWKGYELAKKYTSQHIEKSKIDSDDKYAKLIIETMSEFNLLLKTVLDYRHNLGNEKEAKRIGNAKLPFSGDKRKAEIHLRFILPLFRKDQNETEINSYLSRLQTYSRIINDKLLTDFVASYRSNVQLIFDEFKDKLNETKINLLDQLKSSDDAESTEMYKLSKTLPLGIDDKNSELIQKYLNSYAELNQHLDAFLVSAQNEKEDAK